MSKIYISPSTQEKNLGAGNYGTEEQRMNEIADVVCKCLTSSGISWDRNSPEMTLQEVVEDSNAKKPDIHFAIHSNAGGGRGTEVLIYALGRASEVFAKIIYGKMAPLTPSQDRGIKVRTDLYELRKTTAQACLIEIAFHDNEEDAKFITENIQQIGAALAQGICEYFKVPFKDPYEPDYKILYEAEKAKLDQIREILKVEGGFEK